MDLLAFGFLDPSLVICGCHLVPAFNNGHTTELLTASPSADWPPDETDDWRAFFVNMFMFQSIYIMNLLLTERSVDMWIGICICATREEA